MCVGCTLGGNHHLFLGTRDARNPGLHTADDHETLLGDAELHAGQVRTRMPCMRTAWDSAWDSAFLVNTRDCTGRVWFYG